MEVNYDDNFLNEDEYQRVLNYCFDTNYFYGESDNIDSPVTGMISNIDETEDIYKLFKLRIEEKCPFLARFNLYRMYVNCFAPGENPYFHTDGEGITYLYYVNQNIDLQDGGETQFYIDGTIYGIPPVSNRLVMFDGMILHRATTLRDQHRFTIAIKYHS